MSLYESIIKEASHKDLPTLIEKSLSHDFKNVKATENGRDLFKRFFTVTIDGKPLNMTVNINKGDNFTSYKLDIGNHLLLPLDWEDANKYQDMGLSPLFVNQIYRRLNESKESLNVDYFNEEFNRIYNELKDLREKAKSQGYNDLVYGIDKILETWDNDAIVG